MERLSGICTKSSYRTSPDKDKTEEYEIINPIEGRERDRGVLAYRQTCCMYE